MDRVLALRPLPDAVLLTGDVANSGDPAEHALAAELMAPLTMPIHVVAGNHDLLAERTQFAVEAGGLRIVGCDTSMHGRDDGVARRRLARRSAWRRSRARRRSSRCTTRRSTSACRGWTRSACRARTATPWPRCWRAHLRSSGSSPGTSIARSSSTLGGFGVVTCASTNIQAALDFESREMALTSEPPSFLVHALLGDEIVTHVQPIPLGS